MATPASHADRNRRVRFARSRFAGPDTLCRTNGCTTRLEQVQPGGDKYRCPICGLVVFIRPDSR
jgi:hypothetical protein